MYKIHSHEVRDLLKSTLIVSGCAQYVAEHVLGHAPRDSYEKQASLYPEDPAERVRQGVGAPEHIHEHREAPEGSRRGSRGTAGREGRRRGPPLPKDRGAAAGDAGDACRR